MIKPSLARLWALAAALAVGSSGFPGYTREAAASPARSVGNGSNGGNGGDILGLAFADIGWTVYRDLEARLQTEAGAPGSAWEQLRAKMPELYKELTERTVYSRPDLRDASNASASELWGFDRTQYLPADSRLSAQIPWSAVALANWDRRGTAGTEVVFAFKSDQAQSVGQIDIDLVQMTARVLVDKDISDAVRTGAAFSAACQWQGGDGRPETSSLVCTPDERPGLVASFKVPSTAVQGGAAAAIEDLRLFRQENYLRLNEASWKPRLMGTTRFTSLTKRDVFTVYQKILGIVDPELPYRYQPFPRVGGSVQVAGGTRFLWQREEDPSTFTRWDWTSDRPRHLAPNTPLTATIVAVVASDLGPILRLGPDAATRASGLWAVRRTNPVVGVQPTTGQPYRQLKDDWMWIFWTNDNGLLPQYQTVNMQGGGSAPALRQPQSGTLNFFLDDVKPAQ